MTVRTELHFHKDWDGDWTDWELGILEAALEAGLLYEYAEEPRRDEETHSMWEARILAFDTDLLSAVATNRREERPVVFFGTPEMIEKQWRARIFSVLVERLQVARQREGL